MARKPVKQALSDLKDHPSIIFPAFCSVLITFLLVIVFLFASGSYEVGAELWDLFGKYTDQGAIGSFGSFAESHGFEPASIEAIFSASNVGLIILLFVVDFLLTMYFACMSFALITLVKKRKKASLDNLIDATNQHFSKFFELGVLRLAIFTIPFLIAIIFPITIFVSTGSYVLGGTAVAILFFLFMIYVLVASLRLLFASPALFLEDRGATSALRRTYRITGNHLLKVFVIALIAGIFAFLAQQLPIGQTFAQALFVESALQVILFFVIFTGLLLLEALLISLENLYIFDAYIDYKVKVK